MSTTEKKNSNLQRARRAKNDEFYTKLEDIEKELQHYAQHFNGKTVFLNCDDPYESNFFKYFVMNFDHLGLKKLISVSYASSLLSKESHKVEITEVPDFNIDGDIDLIDVEELLKMDANTIKTLKGDGDFRSDESIELLKQSDIVVTNPPFSLFREFISQLIEYGKEFLVIGNMNAITYKEIWPLIQAGDLWLGVQSPKRFIVGDTMPDKAGQTINQSGKREQAFGNILWFTNLGHDKRNEELPLWKHYTPEEYPKYDNYDAINVNKVKEIPLDYEGAMGVPITFLDKWNPDQFEILGLANSGHHFGPIAWRTVVGGKNIYNRILVRRKM